MYYFLTGSCVFFTTPWQVADLKIYAKASTRLYVFVPLLSRAQSAGQLAQGFEFPGRKYSHLIFDACHLWRH